MKIPYVITKRNGENTVTVYVPKRPPLTLNGSHPNFNEVVSELRLEDPNAARVVRLMNQKIAVADYSHNEVVINNEKVYYGSSELHSVVADRVCEFMRQDLPYEPLVNFIKNIMQNPSENSRNALYTFLENGGFPITPDGCFIGYKSVSDDFYSSNSGYLTMLSGKTDREETPRRIYNAPGEKISVSREEVDPNINVACSVGLHVANFSYANTFSEVLVAVKVNPKDVVSVPTDCSCQKCRVCAYEVIEVIDGKESAFTEALLEPSQIQKTPHGYRDPKTGRWVKNNR